MLEIFQSLEVVFGVMGTLLSKFPNFDNPNSKACFPHLDPSGVCSSINKFFDFTVLAMSTEVDIKEAVELQVESILREMIVHATQDDVHVMYVVHPF